MPIVTTCGQCGKSYRVADQFAGKKAKCKACGAAMTVPLPPPPPKAKVSDDDFDFGALADMEGSAQVDASQPMAMTAPPRSAQADKEESALPRGPLPPTRPKPPQVKPNRFQILAGANAAVILAFIVGIVLLYMGWHEYSLNAHAKKPQLISCLELGRDGPGDNNMVNLVKFGYSVGLKIPRGSCTLVPAFATDSDYGKTFGLAAGFGSKSTKFKIPPPDPIQVIIKTRNPSTALIAKLEDQLQGMVINSIEPLTPDEIKQFQPAYPLTNFAKVWIVEEGREPGSAVMFLLYFGLGGICLLIGIAMLLLGG